MHGIRIIKEDQDNFVFDGFCSSLIPSYPIYRQNLCLPHTANKI
jgi:hypothetical protein